MLCHPVAPPTPTPPPPPPTPSSSSWMSRLDGHMAELSALDPLCHHALTLIGLMCYSSASERSFSGWRSALMSAGRGGWRRGESVQRSVIYHGAKIRPRQIKSGGGQGFFRGGRRSRNHNTKRCIVASVGLQKLNTHTPALWSKEINENQKFQPPPPGCQQAVQWGALRLKVSLW